MNEHSSEVEAGFAKIQIDAAKRHIFLCIGPDCCSTNEGEATWTFLKSRLKELRIPAMRTKAACLRICAGGPWMVVYPEGVWYGQVTAERCARIVEEHLVQERPVTEWIVRRQVLGP
jgi:(2Fe-2S) ferredoxin